MNDTIKRYYNNNLMIIFIIFLLILLFLSATFAYWTWISSDDDDTEVFFTVTEDFTCSVDGGGDITNNDAMIIPTTCDKSENVIKREITLNATVSGNMYLSMDVWLDINSIGSGLTNSQNFMYALTKGDTSCSEDVIVSGSFNGKGENDTIPLYGNAFSSSFSDKYYLWIWLDSAEESASTMDQSFNLSLSGLCQSNAIHTISNYVSSIYDSADKVTVINDSVEYNYASSVSMMNDRLGGFTTDKDAGNIRYYGQNPNNYVYFNCHSYDYQNSQNCELWRIIGVFKNVDDGTGKLEDRVKIIRADTLGGYTFDTTSSSVNSGNGSNDWVNSDLRKMLNPGNDNNQDYNSSSQLVTVNNSLYWNRTSGSCYVSRSNSVGTCNFSSNGITDASKSMIGDAVYYLGSFGEEEIALMTGTFQSFMDRFHAHEMYAYERSENVNACTDIINEDGVCQRPTEWTGKIALMYPSDYIYATDFNLCSYDGISFGWSDWTHTSSGFVTDACYVNDWLRKNNDEWLISPHNTPIYRSFTLQGGKYIYGAYNYRPYHIRPVLYLNSDILVKYGNGTLEKPYQLIYNTNG